MSCNWRDLVAELCRVCTQDFTVWHGLKEASDQVVAVLLVDQLVEFDLGVATRLVLAYRFYLGLVLMIKRDRVVIEFSRLSVCGNLELFSI